MKICEICNKVFKGKNLSFQSAECNGLQSPESLYLNAAKCDCVRILLLSCLLHRIFVDLLFVK